jgi:hypothetical protein
VFDDDVLGSQAGGQTGECKEQKDVEAFHGGVFLMQIRGCFLRFFRKVLLK